MVRFLHTPRLWRILKTKKITAKLNDEYSASFSYSSRSEARILIYRNWPKPYLFIYLFIYFNLFDMLFLAICKQCNEFLSKKALISQMRKSAAAPPTPEPVTEAPLEVGSRELEGVSRKWQLMILYSPVRLSRLASYEDVKRLSEIFAIFLPC